MPGFESMGRVLIILGGLILVVGLVLTFAPKIPFLGRLPGDILIKRDNFTFYFPLVSCLAASFLLTILVNAIFWLLGR